jgi:hypothetical protein
VGLMYSQAIVTLFSIREESNACVIRWIENWNLGSTGRQLKTNENLGKASSSGCVFQLQAYNAGI